MVVDEHVLHMADFPVRRGDVVSNEILAASQVAVVRRLDCPRTPGLQLGFDGVFGRQAAWICSHAPQTSAAPVRRVPE